MTKCQICGSQTSTKTEIKDKRFSVTPDGFVPVCKTCFDFWCSGNEGALVERIKLKLTIPTK